MRILEHEDIGIGMNKYWINILNLWKKTDYSR